VTTPGRNISTGAAVLAITAAPESMRIVSDLLGREGYAVQIAHSGNLALLSVRECLPELILLDITMPDMDGVEICRRLKSHKATRDIPIILLATHGEMLARVKDLDLGVQDYIAKPYLAAEVSLRVRTQLELRSLRADMEMRVRQRTAQIETAANALRDEINMRRKAEAALELAGKVFEASIDAIMVTDVDGAIMAINPAFTRITGYSDQDVLGKSPGLLKSDRHDEQFYKTIWATIKESGYWTGEVWNKRKDGNVSPMMETISACTDRDGNVTNYISVIVDVSEMKDA